MPKIIRTYLIVAAVLCICTSRNPTGTDVSSKAPLEATVPEHIVLIIVRDNPKTGSLISRTIKGISNALKTPKQFLVVFHDGKYAPPNDIRNKGETIPREILRIAYAETGFTYNDFVEFCDVEFHKDEEHDETMGKIKLMYYLLNLRYNDKKPQHIVDYVVKPVQYDWISVTDFHSDPALERALKKARKNLGFKLV